MIQVYNREMFGITGVVRKQGSAQFTRLLSLSRLFCSKASFTYTPLPNKRYIRIRGPDTVKFLNGLVTSKLLPTYVKKNLTTISPDDLKMDISRNIEEFDMSKSNWGLFNEVGELGPYISRFGTYTGILNSKGKLITDSIIYPTPIWLDQIHSKKYPEYLLEFDHSVGERMYHIFDTHRLTSKVKFKMIPSGKLKTWHVSIKFPELSAEEENPWMENLIIPSESLKNPEQSLEFTRHIMSTFFNGSEDKILGIYVDKRTSDILSENNSEAQVFRIITKEDIEDISQLFNPQGFPFDFDLKWTTASKVRDERFRNGILDSVSDYKQDTLLPLEINFDYYNNAVSFDKGCYVGQELTARTFSTGILRKRLVPVRITNSELLHTDSTRNYFDIFSDSQSTKLSNNKEETTPHNPFGNAAKPARLRKERPAGSLIAFEKEYGVALLRTEHFTTAFLEDVKPNFYIMIPDSNTKVPVKPQKPFWLDYWLEDNSTNS